MARQREVYDIESLNRDIEKNSTQMGPEDYTGEKMPIFGANINLRRQIPEIKDGLTPVQRRILMAMYMNKISKGRLAKSLKVIAETQTLYHPHGDSSIYQSIVSMAQPWRNNVSFIDREGNFGTAFNMDSYADARYTGCCLNEFAYDCYFSDWHLTTPETDMIVDWISNYNDEGLEPMYLPAKYPIFLMLYRRAMGLGRYSGLLGFSFTDACNAVIKLIKNPDDRFVMYPDDPEGCDIINGSDFRNVLDATDLKCKVRSTYEINHYNGKDVIEIVSTPFEVNPQTVIHAIKELAIKGKFPEISDISGASYELGDKLMISVEVRKGYDPEQVMRNIYKLTQCENTYVAKYCFVNGLRSVDYTIRVAILEWIRFRKETLKRIYKSERIEIIKKIHYLVPLIKVIESGEIDKFIKIVRTNKSEDAVKKIMDNWDLTDYQASKIVSVKISDLSKDKLETYKDELKKASDRETELAPLTENPDALNDIIIAQLEDGIKKYGTKRKSKVYQNVGNDVPDTMHYLVFTSRYIKKLPYEDKGYRIGRVENGDKVIKVLAVNNRDMIAVFTSDGRCTPIKVSDIGNSNLQSNGISYTTLGSKEKGFVDAINITQQSDSGRAYMLASLTMNGLISKTLVDDIAEKTKSFSLMKIAENDEMVSVKMCTNDDRFIVYTKSGKESIFSADDFESTSYNTKGVISIKPEDGDIVTGMGIIHGKSDSIVILTDRGYVKKIKVSMIPATKRNGRPVEILSAQSIVDVVSIDETPEDTLFICTTDGVYQLDPMNIKATNRLGKPERAAELKTSDYAFGFYDNSPLATIE